MSVKIRLKRMGSKKRPFYRIITTDSRNARDGRFIETLGYYNPMTDPADIKIKEDLVYKWMERGAQPSGTTEQILRSTGVLKKWSLLKQGVSRDELEAKYEELKSKETPPVSAAEKKQKAEAKKAEAEAALKAEEDAKAETETKAAVKAEAPVEKAPAEEVAAEEAPAEEVAAEKAPAEEVAAEEAPAEEVAAEEAPAEEVAAEEAPAEEAPAVEAEAPEAKAEEGSADDTDKKE